MKKYLLTLLVVFAVTNIATAQKMETPKSNQFADLSFGFGNKQGIGCMAFIVFAKQIIVAFPSTASTLSGVATIAWPWYVLIGLSITFVSGMLSSFTHAAPSASETRASELRV